MMRLLRSICTAFGLYSRIPVPNFKWTEEDMAYQAAAFPLVGLVIGILYSGLFILLKGPDIPADLFVPLILTVLPVIITGGFHLDGFMDTCDALNSYQDREKKLEIMKDPHVGSFAVIRAIEYVLLYLAAVTQIRNMEQLAAVSSGFVLSRSISGLLILRMPKAKKDGMLYQTSAAAGKYSVPILIAELLLAAGFALVCGRMHGAAALAAAGLSTVYCVRLFRREFGGISGDLAGYFLCVCELAVVMAAAVSGWMTGAL